MSEKMVCINEDGFVNRAGRRFGPRYGEEVTVVGREGGVREGGVMLLLAEYPHPPYHPDISASFDANEFRPVATN